MYQVVFPSVVATQKNTSFLDLKPSYRESFANHPPKPPTTYMYSAISTTEVWLFSSGGKVALFLKCVATPNPARGDHGMLSKGRAPNE